MLYQLFGLCVGKKVRRVLLTFQVRVECQLRGRIPAQNCQQYSRTSKEQNSIYKVQI